MTKELYSTEDLVRWETSTPRMFAEYREALSEPPPAMTAADTMDWLIYTCRERKFRLRAIDTIGHWAIWWPA